MLRVRKLNLGFAGLAVAVFVTVGSVSSAQTMASPGERVGSIGAMLGIAFLNNQGGSVLTYGAGGDWFVFPAMELGIQFNMLSPTNTLVNGVAYTNTLTNLDGKILFVPGGTYDGLKLGGLLGFGVSSSSAPGSSSSTNLNYGVTGQYDRAVGERWTFGPQVDIIWNTATNGYTEVNAMANLKYWFGGG